VETPKGYSLSSASGTLTVKSEEIERQITFTPVVESSPLFTFFCGSCCYSVYTQVLKKRRSREKVVRNGCWVQSCAEDARDGEAPDAFPSEPIPPSKMI
jgi:hypothetical protein